MSTAAKCIQLTLALLNLAFVALGIVIVVTGAYVYGFSAQSANTSTVVICT